MTNWYCEGNDLIESMKQLHAPETCAAIWSIGQCGIFVKYRDSLLLIDPVLTPINDADGTSRKHFEAPFLPSDDFPVDVVLCTHNHLDHFNPDTIRGIAASHPNTRFIIPAGVLQETASVCESFHTRVTGIRQGETITWTDDISVSAVAAAHDHYQSDDHGNEKALGYILHLGNINLFHAGDTLATSRLVREVNANGPIHIAFLPINGRDWIREENDIIGNMTPQEAALFAEQIQCDTVIPTHYDMMLGNEENPLIFAQYMRERYPDRLYHILKPGEPFLYYRNISFH